MGGWWRMFRAAILAAAALAAACNPATNTPISVVRSPDGRHEAVLFERNAGATTGFSTQISIVAADERPAGGGNAFIADDDNGRAKAAGWGGPYASMAWLGTQQLEISYDRDARLFRNEQRVEGVQVTYRAVYPPS